MANVTISLTIPDAKVADGIAAIQAYLIDRGDLPVGTVLTGAQAAAEIKKLLQARLVEIYQLYYHELAVKAATQTADSQTKSVILT